ARERMIEVEIHVEVPYLHDPPLAQTVSRLYGHHLAGRIRPARREVLHGHALDGVRIPLAVAMLRRNRRGELVAALLTDHFGFEPRHDVVTAMQVDHGTRAVRALGERAFDVAELVMKRDDGVVGDALRLLGHS